MRFLDLPEDVLHQIINEELLCVEDLYHLATVSHLLQNIALPAYLRTYDLHNPTSYTAVYINQTKVSSPDSLLGLAISTNLITIDYLVCYLYGGRSSSSGLEVMQRRLLQLCRVVNRLDKISRFRIYLLGNFGPPSGSVIFDVDLKIWTDSIGCLLNTVINNGCIDLTVHSGYWSQEPYNFHTINPRNPLQAIRYLARRLADSKQSEILLFGPSWQFSRPQEGNYPEPIVMNSSPRSLASSALSSFTIQSRMFLVPPFLGWTVSILSHGTNITSLTFKLSHLKSEIWRIVLDQVALVISTRLRKVHFQLQCNGIHLRDILAFLSKTTSLTHLEIHGFCNVTKPELCNAESFTNHHCSFGAPYLPSLQFLVAPPFIASHLLSRRCPLDISPLPNLEEWETFFDARELCRKHTHVKDYYQKHAGIRERVCIEGSSQNTPKFVAHILGRPYRHAISSFDKDRLTMGTFTGFPAITKAKFETMPTRHQLLDDAFTFLQMMNLRFPELREIEITHFCLHRMSNVIPNGSDTVDEDKRLQTIEDVLSLLKKLFMKLERVVTEKETYQIT